jgi:hypothetical protein
MATAGGTRRRISLIGLSHHGFVRERSTLRALYKTDGGPLFLCDLLDSVLEFVKSKSRHPDDMVFVS